MEAIDCFVRRTNERAFRIARRAREFSVRTASSALRAAVRARHQQLALCAAAGWRDSFQWDAFAVCRSLFTHAPLETSNQASAAGTPTCCERRSAALQAFRCAMPRLW